MTKTFLVAVAAAVLAFKAGQAAQTAADGDALADLETMLERNDVLGLCNLAENGTCFGAPGDALDLALKDLAAARSRGMLDYSFDVAANNGQGKGRGYVPWKDRPGKGRKDPPPRHPHIY